MLIDFCRCGPGPFWRFGCCPQTSSSRPSIASSSSGFAAGRWCCTPVQRKCRVFDDPKVSPRGGRGKVSLPSGSVGDLQTFAPILQCTWVDFSQTLDHFTRGATRGGGETFTQRLCLYSGFVSDPTLPPLVLFCKSLLIVGISCTSGRNVRPAPKPSSLHGAPQTRGMSRQWRSTSTTRGSCGS